MKISLDHSASMRVEFLDEALFRVRFDADEQTREPSLVRDGSLQNEWRPLISRSAKLGKPLLFRPLQMAKL